MKIAKPLLLVGTPVGVFWGISVAYRMHHWLAVLMIILIGIIGMFIGYTVYVIRRETQQENSINKNPENI